MATDSVYNFGLTGRALPSVSQDNTYGPGRHSRYGDQYVLPLTGAKLWSLADEGSYFVATNPTAGTGIAGIAAADGLSALETLFLLYNTATAAEGKRLYLDFLELQCTVVDTNGTDIRVDWHIDNTDRFSSGGSNITPVNPNMDSTASPKGRLRFGAVVSTAASSSVRYLGGRQLASTDLVANDIIRLDFGGSNAFSSQAANLTEEGTLARMWQMSVPPVVLGPGCCFLLSVNCASQSGAATWAFNTGWAER